MKLRLAWKSFVVIGASSVTSTTSPRNSILFSWLPPRLNAMSRQILERLRRAVLQIGVAGEEAAEALQQFLRDQAGIRQRADADGKVDALRDEIGHPIHHHHFHLDRRKFLPVPGDQLGQQTAAEHGWPGDSGGFDTISGGGGNDVLIRARRSVTR